MSISISIPLATSKTPHDPTPRADAVPTDRFETALEHEQVPTDSTPRMRKPRPATEASQEAATRTSPSEGERDAREDAPDTTTEDHAVDAPGAHVQSAATAWTSPIPTPPAKTADAGDIAKAIDPKATDEVLSTVPRSVGMPPSFAALAPEDTPATPVFAALGDETPTGALPNRPARTPTPNARRRRFRSSGRRPSPHRRQGDLRPTRRRSSRIRRWRAMPRMRPSQPRRRPQATQARRSPPRNVAPPDRPRRRPPNRSRSPRSTSRLHHQRRSRRK